MVILVHLKDSMLKQLVNLFIHVLIMKKSIFKNIEGRSENFEYINFYLVTLNENYMEKLNTQTGGIKKYKKRNNHNKKIKKTKRQNIRKTKTRRRRGKNGKEHVNINSSNFVPLSLN